ncbi:uncharacterized protein LOC123268660 isoform X1 [Cotesia glomerata]|uniref:RRM domain-containing protein n=2 Tax=Cotesia glomerata TaxID=32391 RepID=A0AAV7J9I3_COTGL|nr:uncharacterized protein LOC123268660 isoform X1 [Cotesia glomerata]KAH0568257.1 hypothetical protein KQX54_019870 [Cotesia glomerata]
MSKTINNENGEAKNGMNKQDTTYGYETSYSSYYPSSNSPSTANQPLPGQPPLPPMPPPPGALPPLPHVFSPMPQVTQIQSWAPAPAWQWITPQATALAAQTSRDITNSTRGNYTRRDRFTHNRNNVYPPRGNFHRKNRRPRFDQTPTPFDPTTAYFGQSLAAGNISIDWQRGFAAAHNDAQNLVNHMAMSMSNQSSGVNDRQDGDQDVKIVSELPVKKGKQRKPMSQNYPSRPWNREDAQSALKVENEYNKTVRAQSLIIKFPDPDLNKDIVREFHTGIQNIHFQSPSGPRYCFIQMAENVNIDEAIKELEKIPFGVGHLKVERKSLRDEDFPMPEEIDPYTLYVGNLPESVNVNEVKSKFPTATRVDVGYAQKMRNTRYAFIRYTSVEESIAAYKQAHDLMWDTRSIIVRFRRQRGNTCLPGEPKSNTKKVKEEPNNVNVKTEQSSCTNNQTSKNNHNNKTSEDIQQTIGTVSSRSESNNTTKNIDVRFSSDNSPITVIPTEISQQKQPWTEKSPLLPPAAEAPPPPPENESESILITTIKEEPEDFDEMEIPYVPMDDGEDDDDDDDDEPDQLDDSNDEMEDGQQDDLEEQTDYYESEIQNKQNSGRAEQPDHLDRMFNELENIVGDIEL